MSPSPCLTSVEQLLRTLPHLVWLADAQGMVTACNPQWTTYTGQSETDLLTEPWWQGVHPQDCDRARTAWHSALSTQTPHQGQLRLRHHARNQYITTLWHAEPLYNDQQILTGWLSTFTPSPQITQLESRLRAVEERYQLLTDRSSDLITSYTPTGQYLYASPASQTLLGYDPSELVGQSIYDFFHPEDLDTLHTTYSDTLPQTSTYTYRIRRKDDTYIWFETTNQVIMTPDGGTIREVIAISRDITERKQAELEILRVNHELESRVNERTVQLDTINRLYHSVLTSIEEVIFQTDTTGRWIFLSSPWKAITGYTVEETLNSSFLDYVFTQEDRDRLTDLFQSLLLRERESFEYEFRFPTKNRNFRWLELYAQLHQDSAGHILGTCGAINDVTPRKQVEAVLKSRADQLNQQREQIEQQNQALMQASQLKSQFLATMSHELRTPMNAIMGFSQMLMLQQYGPLSPRQVDMVERIFNNSQNLLTLLNEVLDFSKIEAGYWDVNFQCFDSERLLRGTVDELRSLAQKKNLPLQVNIATQNPQIVSDQNCLRRLLVNLLSNAIKFTDHGHVTVTLRDKTPNSVQIEVQDTGIGIAEADHEVIFEAFRQVDQTLTRKHPGTGLGLAIVKSLVQMMHGTITIASQPGKGSTFTVDLPRDRPELPGEPLTTWSESEL